LIKIQDGGEELQMVSTCFNWDISDLSRRSDNFSKFPVGRTSLNCLSIYILTKISEIWGEMVNNLSFNQNKRRLSREGQIFSAVSSPAFISEQRLGIEPISLGEQSFWLRHVVGLERIREYFNPS